MASHNKQRRPIRLAALFGALLALMIAVPGTAVAQTGEYRASGQADGFALELPDAVEIAGARSQANISSDLLAHARGVGFLTAEGSISEVTIEQAGVSLRDPETGENCAGPEIPAPLDLVDVACSVAQAETLESLPSARSTGSGLELELTGADVVALVDFLLGHIDEAGLGTAIDEIETAVLEPVRLALAEACLAGLSELDPLFAGANELITAIEEESGDLVGVDLQATEACALLVQYVTDPPVLVDADGDGQAGPDDVLIQLRDTLAATLEGVSILDILLGGSDSQGVSSAATAVGSSSAIGVDVALPSLNLLGNLLDTLTSIVDGFLTEVAGDLEPIADVNFEEIGLPVPADLVDTLLAAVPQELQDVLGDDQPLLRITGGKSDATATFDRATAEVTTEGQVAPLVLDLADSLAILLGISDQDPITVPEGDEFTLAEGTPLETTARLASCSTVDATEDGLDGKRISCDGLELVLLKGLVGDDPETEAPDGGIRIAAATAQAAAFGAAGAAPAAPPLPTTGGGAAMLAIALMGLAVTLRRPW